MPQRIDIRKILTVTEDIHSEGLRKLEVPTRKAAAIAVIKNPCAGRYVEDLDFLLTDYGGRMATMLTELAVKTLGVPLDKIHNFGKGGIVGLDGEIEHASAILHGATDPSFGYNLRQVIQAGKSVIRSVEKRGAAGTALDISLSYKDAERVRSHFDSMEVRVPDAPLPDEIVLVVVLTNAGRPLPRIGGLKVENIKGLDGLT